jgi:hypothetical protein
MNPARHPRTGTAHRRSLLGLRLVPVLVRAAAVGMRRSLRVPSGPLLSAMSACGAGICLPANAMPEN